MATNNSIYIPQVFASLSKQKIADLFLDNNIGHVSNVKLIAISKSHGPQINKAYVYIDQWCDSEAAYEVQRKLFRDTTSNNKRAELHYAESKYWILLPNNDRSMQLAKAAPVASVPVVLKSGSVASGPVASIAASGPVASTVASSSKLMVPLSVVKRQLGIPIRIEHPAAAVQKQPAFMFSGFYETMIDGEVYVMPIPADVPDPDIFDDDESQFDNSANKFVSSDYAEMLEEELDAMRNYNMVMQSNCDAWETAYNSLVNQIQFDQQQQQQQYQQEQQYQYDQQQQEQLKYDQQQQHDEWLMINSLMGQQEQQEYCM